MFLENNRIFGIPHELRNGVLRRVSRCPKKQIDRTYARHQLEDRGLGHLKQLHNLLETLEHSVIITHRFGHTAGQAIAQSVINIKLAWRSGGQKGIVDICQYG